MALKLSAFASPTTSRLLTGWAAAALATWAFSILLAVHAYRQGGAGAVGVAVLVRMAPVALLAPWLTAAVDRSSRRAALVASALGRGGALAALAAAVAVDAALAVVLGLAAAYMVADGAHRPAQAALLPQVVRTPAELAAANAAWSSTDSAAFLAGSLLAGILAASVDLAAGFAVCVVPLVLAAIVLARLPIDVRPGAAPGVEPTGWLAQAGRGLRTVADDPQLRLVAAVYAADMLVQAMIDVLLVVAALELLGLGEPGAGWLSAAWGVGGLAGGLVAARVLRRGRMAFGLRAGCLMAGLPLCLVGVVGTAGPALVALVVLGAGFAIVEAILMTLTQRLAADDVLARVAGVQLALHVVGTAAGSLLAATLVGAVGVATALVVTGALLPVLAGVLWPALAGFDTRGTVPGDVFALVRALPLFAPLPLATVETLVLRMRAEDREEGALLIEQGAPGDDFYVLAAGEVEVCVDGAVVRRQRPGSFFGEIALLRDVPRTASVRAVTPVRVLRLGRRDFLTGIGAHPRSARAADAVALERLAAPTAPLRPAPPP